MKAGRNEPCHCGSGKKLKHCHGRENSTDAGSRRIGWAIGGIVIAGVIALFVSMRDSDDAEVARPSKTETAAPVALPQAAVPAVPVPQPAAPVAPVANPAASMVKIQTQTVTGTPGKEFPQPPGPAPAGKVWSKEHGHWHDVSTAEKNEGQVPSDLEPYIQPPGIPPAPPGLVWSQEHHHWHRADAEAARKAAATGTAATSTAPTTTTATTTGSGH